MGSVVPYKPKSLVEFEKSAARLVAHGSRFLTDVPAVMRVARLMQDELLAERVQSLIVPLSALANAVGILEEYAPAIADVVDHDEPVVLHVENAGEVHNVLCHARVRQNVVHISKFELRNRTLVDRLTNEPPRVFIELEFNPSAT